MKKGNLPLEKIKKILIVRPDAIGDMVLTLPCIKAIKDTYPHMSITVLASGYNAKVIEHLDYIDNIIIDWFAKGEVNNWKDVWKYSRFLKKENFDAAVHFYSETPQIWTSVLARIPYHLGDKAKVGLWPVLRKHGVFLKSFDQTKHVIDYNFQLLEPLNVKKPTNLKQVLYPDGSALERSGKLLKEAGYRMGRRLVGIHPGVGAEIGRAHV